MRIAPPTPEYRHATLPRPQILHCPKTSAAKSLLWPGNRKLEQRRAAIDDLLKSGAIDAEQHRRQVALLAERGLDPGSQVADGVTEDMKKTEAGDLIRQGIPVITQIAPTCKL